AEDGIRDRTVTGVQTCALPILVGSPAQPRFALRRHPFPRAADLLDGVGVVGLEARRDQGAAGGDTFAEDFAHPDSASSPAKDFVPSPRMKAKTFSSSLQAASGPPSSRPTHWFDAR